MPPCPRQRIQIIWTCVATILAASWVSVHPNIPNPKESAIKKTLRRIELMIWAILAPELIILWAMRQWYGARLMEKEFAEFQHTELEYTTRKLLRRLKELGYKLRLRRNTPLKPEPPRWTRTHGFFLQMGGFMLREEGKDRVLGWETLKEYYKQGRLDLSDITEDRINDHSKADGFAKGLALLQMFWFITQCVARFFDKNLILTELELATAALALLSFAVYLLWWNKPFNAGVPITITLLPAETDPQSKDDANSQPGFVADSINTLLPIPDTVNPNVPHAQPVDNVTFAPPPNPQSVHSRVHFVSGSQPTDRPPLPPTLESDKSSDGVQLWFLFIRFIEMIKGYDGIDPFDVPGGSAVTSVPSFYSILADSEVAYLQMRLTSFLAAALFGSIHCIGWSSKIVFASHAASLAWRIVSATITACPVVWCLELIFVYAYNTSKYGSALERMFDYLSDLSGYALIATIPVYIFIDSHCTSTVQPSSSSS
ncbi:hypothetical protein D9613_008319 [Agrocybe pediades]|uniref:Uncharacterized protein n=1 Tax=Agrocybe pediades TaxID=84607 RepID=A0A8H4VNM1_9AGAR|nr:hypothetical protein D9613_008319 [Agrocybe pediades]